MKELCLRIFNYQSHSQFAVSSNCNGFYYFHLEMQDNPLKVFSLEVAKASKKLSLGNPMPLGRCFGPQSCYCLIKTLCFSPYPVVTGGFCVYVDKWNCQRELQKRYEEEAVGTFAPGCGVES